MENNIFNAKTVLFDLQKFASEENEISTLTALNRIISTSQEDIEYLHNSDGIDVIVSFLKSDSRLTNICLKLLANAAKRHPKIREKLLDNNIFYLLAEKLKRESDFLSNNVILYCALIVLLLQENYHAQNQMRKSGCLTAVLYTLNCILDEMDGKPLPQKTTELLIYTVISSSKEPRNFENQTEVGWIIPKILEYLGKQTIFSSSDQIHIKKCFWFFLKTALDKNELNQQIFLESFGFCILFRSIQDIVEEGNCKEMISLLVKMTGVLIKFKSNKLFLSQASNYCPIKILCNLLKTYNILVIQQTIIFLNSLTREFPFVLQLMRENEILRRIKRARIILLESKTEEFCKDLWNRMQIFYPAQSLFQECFLEENTQLGCSLTSETQTYQKFTSELSFHSQTHFCVVHDTDLTTNFQVISEPVPKNLEENKDRGENSRKNKISVTNVNFHRKKIRERERKLKITMKNISPSLIMTIAGRIKRIFHNFTSFFTGTND